VWIPVEEEFGSADVGSLGADIAIILDMVTTNGPSYTVWNCLFWPVCTHNPKIHGCFAMGNGRDWDEKHGIGPWHCWCTLGQAVYFSGVGSFPECAISAVAKGIFHQFSGIQVECIAMVCHVLTKMGSMVAWGMALLSWYVVLAMIAGGGCSIIMVWWDEDWTCRWCRHRWCDGLLVGSTLRGVAHVVSGLCGIVRVALGGTVPCRMVMRVWKASL